ncbi:MAG: hypothetical protein E7529_01490 [Ruminococcaceae bacterium]|nr:hypothetical protein [Oscillospiraceae bacterium]
MKKRKATKFLSLLCILCIITNCFCGCSSTQSIVTAIETGDYETADEIYLKKVENGSDVSDLRYAVEEFLWQKVEEYNENTISENETQTFFTTVASCSFYDAFDIYPIENEFTSLRESKGSFSEAERLFKQQEYFEAVRLYEQVSSIDTNYDTSQNKIDEIKKILLSKANDFIDDDNYSSGINLLRECSDLNFGEEFDSAYEKYVQEYINKAIASAKEVFNNKKNYKGAIKKLKAALKDIENADDNIFNPIYDEIDKYLEYEPKPLSSLEPTQQANYIELDEWGSTDVNEKEYEGTIFSPCGGTLLSQTAQSEDEAYVSYYLNAKYSTFTGTIYRPYSTLSCPDSWTGKTVFKVYGDGVLLYEGPQITQKTYDPVAFEIDVSGVRELKIVIMGVWSQSGGWPGQYDRNPKLCAANLTLVK